MLASEDDPRTALVWTECLATSDLPGGVINVLTGHAKEIAPVLSQAPRGDRRRRLDSRTTSSARPSSSDGADNVKRVKTHDVRGLDWSTAQGLGYIERFLETKTVWHPVGL